MKRNAINKIGRLFYSSRIRAWEEKIEIIYKEDWENKPWEEYAKDVFKLETENKELINNSTGSKRMEYTLGLQALYNKKEKELDYIESKVRNMSSSEIKYFFSDEYETIKINIKPMNINDVIEECSNYSEIVKSGKLTQLMNNYMFNYVKMQLLMCAIEEVFGDDLNKIENNLRRNK